MHEVLGPGLGVGAGVDENEVSAFAGHDGGEGGAVDALHHAEPEGAPGHERSGVAATHENACVAVLNQFDSPDHRGVLLFFQGHQGFVVHGDDLRGVKNRESRAQLESGVADQGAKDRLIADERDRVELGLAGKGQLYAEDHFGGPEVGAHGVDCDATGNSGRGIHRVGRGEAWENARLRPRR